MRLKTWARYLGLLILIFLVALGGSYWLSWLWFQQSIQSDPNQPLPTSNPTVMGVIAATSVLPSSVPTLLISPSPSLTPAADGAEAVIGSVSAPSQTPNLISKPTGVSPILAFKPFNPDLMSWEATGQVELKFFDTYQPVCQSANYEASANISQFIQLGSEASPEPLGSHTLSHKFISRNNDLGLEFWYRVWTWETNLGFDDPVLVLTFDDQVIWRIGSAVALDANNFEPEIFAPACSGWQKAIVAWPEDGFVNTPHQVKFLAGQVGDDLNPSWVEVSQLKVIQEKIDLPPESSWPKVVNFFPVAETQVNLFNADKNFVLMSLTELMERLQAPVLANNFELNQPLTHPYQVKLMTNKIPTSLTYSLADNFPFSMTHEGFQSNLSLPNPLKWLDLSSFQPSWLRVTNLWQQPSAVLPINSIENELL